MDHPSGPFRIKIIWVIWACLCGQFVTKNLKIYFVGMIQNPGSGNRIPDPGIRIPESGFLFFFFFFFPSLDPFGSKPCY